MMQLRELRTGIFEFLDGEKDVRITFYINDNEYKYKIGNGKNHLVLNLIEDKIYHRYAERTTSIWKVVWNGSLVFFQFTGNILQEVLWERVRRILGE